MSTPSNALERAIHARAEQRKIDLHAARQTITLLEADEAAGEAGDRAAVIAEARARRELLQALLAIAKDAEREADANTWRAYAALAGDPSPMMLVRIGDAHMGYRKARHGLDAVESIQRQTEEVLRTASRGSAE